MDGRNRVAEPSKQIGPHYNAALPKTKQLSFHERVEKHFPKYTPLPIWHKYVQPLTTPFPYEIVPRGFVPFLRQYKESMPSAEK